MKHKTQRRSFFRKKLALYKSIFSFFLVSGIGIAILAGLYVFVSSMVISIVAEKGAMQSMFGPSTILGKVLVNYWFYALIGAFFLIVVSVFFTHRFAGPLYRLEVSVDRMIKKELGFKIKLRKKDECQVLAGKLDRLNAGLAGTVQEMTEIVNQIDDQQVNLYKEQSGKSKVLKQTIMLNRKLQTILKEFKCS